MTNESSLPAAAPSTDLVPIRARYDGWSPEKQRIFLEVLATTGRVDLSVKSACMSRESAYKLRRHPLGAGFALAWQAALSLARQQLFDQAYELAMTGSVEQIIKDGVVVAERRKRDPRALFDVVDRIGQSEIAASPAAEVIAQDWDEYLDCLTGDAKTAAKRTFKFLKAREKSLSSSCQPAFFETVDRMERLASRKPAASGVRG